MGKFAKGTIPNPTGRPAGIGQIRDLARVHTRDALETIYGIMGDVGTDAKVRLEAAREILDRAWGKPSQHVELLRQDMQVIATLTQDEIEQLAPLAASLLLTQGDD